MERRSNGIDRKKIKNKCQKIKESFVRNTKILIQNDVKMQD